MKTNDQLVSVCVITYNHEKYIHQALDSILAQKTNFPFNIIVADDFSTDNTRKIIDQYAEKHAQKFCVLDHSKKYGIAQNFLRLLDAACGKYIAYLEGDDYWTDPLKLQKQVDFLEINMDFAACQHEVSRINENGTIIQKTLWSNPIPKVITQKDLFRSENLSQTGTWMFRRSCLNGMPNFFRQFPYDRVLAFWITNFGKWGTLPEIMSVYRITDSGVYSKQTEERQTQQLIEIYETIKSHADYNKKYNSEISERLSYLYKKKVLVKFKSKKRSDYIGAIYKSLSNTNGAEQKLSLIKFFLLQLIKTDD
jgi:glycosyltransferase involved in cell wall biosynthesis